MAVFWVKGLLAVVFGFVAVFKAVGQLNKRSAGRARMRSGQRELADLAVVTLTGVVRALAEPLEAPLSGTPCVLHRSTARVYRAVTGRRGVRHVEAELVVVEMVDFILDTRDGPVRVTGEHADVTLRPAAIVPHSIDREMRFLRAQGRPEHPSTCGFDEVVIEPGAKVSVHGIARIEADGGAAGEAGYRDTLTTTRIIGDDAHPLTIGV